MKRPAPLVVALLLALVVDLGASACVSLPRSGGVDSVTAPDTGPGDTLVDYTPAGPERGSAPVPLVENFLTAMTATPLNTHVARQFLTSGRGRRWEPEKGTISYGSEQLVREPGGAVTVRLRDVIELDGRGAWLGDPTSGRGHDYRLRLVKENGQWRIDNAPDRLLIPRAHFDSQYQQYLLYFFDESARGLVPEPVFLPRGRQASTLLVAGLLKGPEPYLRDVERTFLPRGATLDGISVPVSPDGTAEVPLSDEVLDVDGNQWNLLFAQLAWTLGQIPGVERMRVTVDGTPVDLPGSGEDVDVDELSEFDPSVVWASTDLFGLRDGRVVTISGVKEDQVSGPFGTLNLGLRSIAVDLLAQRIAAVTSDGRRVLVADRDGVPGREATRADVQTVYPHGTDVLRPAYDRYGQLWVVDRTRSGARLSVVRGGAARVVPAPGLTGAPVARFVLSRDGTRLVTQVRRGGRDELLVARVQRDTKGVVERVGPARRISMGLAPRRIVDVAWRSPASLAVLGAPVAGSSRVLLARVDGSSEVDEDVDLDLFRGGAVRLVTSQTQGTPLFVGSRDGRLFALSRDGNWTASTIESGLAAPTFVG